MPVTVTFRYPTTLNSAQARTALRSIAEFVRDLWLSKAPSSSGAYARGLMQQNSITIQGGLITVTNHCRHAKYFEDGHRAFNLGLAILNGGKNVKRSKEGYRYKIIKITPGRKASFRKPSVAASVKKAFAGTVPPAVNTHVNQVSKPKSYKRRQSLRKPLKAGGKRKGPDGIFVISEKAIMQDPTKWRSPAMEGRGLAKQVQKDADPIVKIALAKAIQDEADRKGKNTPRKSPVAAPARQAPKAPAKRA